MVAIKNGSESTWSIRITLESEVWLHTINDFEGKRIDEVYLSAMAVLVCNDKSTI